MTETAQTSTPKKFLRKLRRLRAPIDVPSEFYPTLGIFGDVDNLASIERVYPDRMVESFGEGYRL